MAIAFVNAADLGDSGSASSFTVSYTAGSGSNRLLLVGATVDAGFTVSGVTYAGTSLTQIATVTPASGRVSYLFYLLAPTSGANNVVITASGTVAHILGVAADYTGVAQSGQPDNSTTNTVDSSFSAITTSLTSVADNCWGVLITSCVNTGLTWSAGAGATIRVHDGTFSTWAFFDTNGVVHPAGSFSMTANLSGTNAMGAIMASFAPAAAAAGGLGALLSDQQGFIVGTGGLVLA